MKNVEQKGTTLKVKSPYPVVILNNRRHLIDTKKKELQDEKMPWNTVKFLDLDIDQATSISTQLGHEDWFWNK